MTERPTKLYTATGDDGYTGLLGKGRVPKYAPQPEACGQVDELQAVLGLCRAGPLSQRGKELLVVVERDLYRMMSELAAPADTTLSVPTITDQRVVWLERVTDELGQHLPPFKDFVLPGDTGAGALVHLARTVARRAERAVVRLHHEKTLPNRHLIRYLNRLSSFLFALAGYEDKRAGVGHPTFASQD